MCERERERESEKERDRERQRQRKGETTRSDHLRGSCYQLLVVAH